MRRRNNKYNANLLKVLMSIVFLVSLQAAQPMKDFLSTAKEYIGEYSVVETNSGFCDSGFLGFVDSNKPEKGLRVGQGIFLGPFSMSEKVDKTSDDCQSVKSFQFKKNQVVQTSQLRNCPKKFKKLESKSTQILSFKDKTITYESVESKIKCQLKLKEGGK